MGSGRPRARSAAIFVAAVLVVALSVALHGDAAPRPASAAGECRVQGRVLDASGAPVEGIRVQLARDREVVNQATDEDGRYDFGVQSGAGLSSLNVELITEEFAHSPRRFQVFAEQRLGMLRTDTFSPSDPGGCKRDFDARAIPSTYRAQWPEAGRWPDLIEVYQRTHHAWALADVVGERLTYGLPLSVYAWCDDTRLGCRPGMDFAGFAGTRTDGSYRTATPYIVIGDETSALDHGDVPDNREYHEVGHYFLADLFGNQLPLHPDNVPHGGYYRNPSSSDSWTEGFAEFYSLMVAKHVDGEPSPERYRIRGAEYDVELDQQAWGWSGWWEELSLAGLLLDFEDGDEDYRDRGASRSLEIETWRVRRIDGAVAVEGTVRNDGLGEIAYPEVVIELLDANGRVIYRAGAPATPTRLQAGEEGQFLAPLPDGLDHSRVRVSAGPLPLQDDDPLDVTLPHLLDAIADYRGDQAYGNGHVFDVSELYEALSSEFGGRDLDRNGVEDVEQVFRAHGFFADENGNRRWNGGEEPGLTSHPAYDGFPAAMPRPDLPAAPEAKVAIDSGGVATHAVVYLTFAPPNSSRSYGYVTDIVDGEISLAPPPRDYEAEVTIMLLADGFAPAVVARLDNEELWGYWDQAPGESVIEISATLRPDDGGDPEALLLVQGDDDGGSFWPLPPVWSWVLIAEALIIIGAGGIISMTQFRGRNR